MFAWVCWSCCQLLGELAVAEPLFATVKAVPHLHFRWDCECPELCVCVCVCVLVCVRATTLMTPYCVFVICVTVPLSMLTACTCTLPPALPPLPSIL